MSRQTNQIFSEDAIKLIQEYYKRVPNSAPPQFSCYMNPMLAAWPYPMPQVVRPPSSSDSLKSYIERAFSKCTSDAERDTMEKLIKDLIASKRDSGMFNYQDWSRTELPLLAREQVVLPPQTMQVPPLKSNEKIQKRKSRFEPIEIEEDFKPRPATRVKEEKIYDIGEWKIVGTCTELEKPYFRLTSKPDPSTIRPEHVLKKALAWLKDRWRRGEIKYEFFSDQLRSIRQDLTVQGIQNKFSVEIYQVHTRLALEAQDLDQYNSCMSRLFELYKTGLPGRIPVISKQEFKAYQIMYYTLQNLFLQLEKSLKALSQSEKKTQEIKQALVLKSAVVLGNYHQVFQLRPSLSHCGPHLLDIFTPKLRALSLLKICKA